MSQDWRQEKRPTEYEMVGWHHRLDEDEFEQALGLGDGQGSLLCCSPWGRKESDMTEQLNWTEREKIESWTTRDLTGKETEFLSDCITCAKYPCWHVLDTEVYQYQEA